MSAPSEVPVYYLDSSIDDSPCRIDSRDECRKNKREGLGFFINHGRAFRLHEKTPIMESILAPSGTTAPSTISLGEMLANVGIFEDWDRDPYGKVIRAREKVRVYPFVGDPLAPLPTYS